MKGRKEKKQAIKACNKAFGPVRAQEIETGYK